MVQCSDKTMEPLIDINVWNTPFIAHDSEPTDNQEKCFR